MIFQSFVYFFHQVPSKPEFRLQDVPSLSSCSWDPILGNSPSKRQRSRTKLIHDVVYYCSAASHCAQWDKNYIKRTIIYYIMYEFCTKPLPFRGRIS